MIICLVRIVTRGVVVVVNGALDQRDKKARWMVVEVVRQERVASKKFR